jgi:hypothetical protein
MTNWTQQTEEMFSNFAETQKNMMNDWMKVMTPTGDAQTQVTEVFNKSIDTCEQAVQQILTTETQWQKNLVDELNKVDNLPDEVKTLIAKANEMNPQWQENRENLLNGWFETMRKCQPKMADMGVADAQKAVQTWQDSMKKMVDGNMNFANLWTQKKEA